MENGWRVEFSLFSVHHWQLQTIRDDKANRRMWIHSKFIRCFFFWQKIERKMCSTNSQAEAVCSMQHETVGIGIGIGISEYIFNPAVRVSCVCAIWRSDAVRKCSTWFHMDSFESSDHAADCIHCLAKSENEEASEMETMSNKSVWFRAFAVLE